jgi:hypothetical protein
MWNFSFDITISRTHKKNTKLFAEGSAIASTPEYQDAFEPCHDVASKDTTILEPESEVLDHCAFCTQEARQRSKTW